MKVLLINGSPKGNVSDTLHISSAFCDGMMSVCDFSLSTVNVADRNVEHCRGCFYCWNNPNGECVIKDDMSSILQEFIDSDVIVWSFPLYYYSMPSGVKALMDRTLPLLSSKMAKTDDGTNYHPARVDLASKRYVLISGCGFADFNGIFDALERQFQHVFQDRLTTLFVPEAPMFSVDEAKPVCDAYLEHVATAGKEFVLYGEITPQTRNKLNAPLIPQDLYIKICNGER